MKPRYRIKVEKVAPERDAKTVAQYVVIDTTLEKTDPEGSRVTVHTTRELAESTIREHDEQNMSETAIR